MHCYDDEVDNAVDAMTSIIEPVMIVFLAVVVGTIVAIFTFEVARNLLIEAALSFLGLGVQPPTPTWGRMLADGRNYMMIAQWVITYPGMAIMLSVLGINMLGDAIRDIVDVKL